MNTTYLQTGPVDKSAPEHTTASNYLESTFAYLVGNTSEAKNL